MNKRFRKNILIVIIIAFFVLFPHFIPLPFYSYAIVCLAVIIFYLRKENKTLRNLGLKRNGITAHVVVVGVVSALLWVAFNKWVYHPFITHFFVVPSYTEYDFIRNKLSNLVITIIAAWVIGGFYEEIVFRGFIQTKMQELIISYKNSFWIAGLFTSLLFGLYHWQQGIFGIVPAFLGGLLWTFLLWRYKGNLWYPVISHAVYDTIALTMIYFGIVI
jgi:membrane protease YdiL (CAAX protease family)